MSARVLSALTRLGSVASSLGGSKRGIQIDEGGTNIPVFLLDGSYFVITIVPSTTAAAVCIAIRQKVRSVAVCTVLSAPPQQCSTHRLFPDVERGISSLSPSPC